MVAYWFLMSTRHAAICQDEAAVMECALASEKITLILELLLVGRSWSFPDLAITPVGAKMTDKDHGQGWRVALSRATRATRAPFTMIFARLKTRTAAGWL